MTRCILDEEVNWGQFLGISATVGIFAAYVCSAALMTHSISSMHVINTKDRNQYALEQKLDETISTANYRSNKDITKKIELAAMEQR